MCIYIYIYIYTYTYSIFLRGFLTLIIAAPQTLSLSLRCTLSLRLILSLRLMFILIAISLCFVSRMFELLFHFNCYFILLFFGKVRLIFAPYLIFAPCFHFVPYIISLSLYIYIYIHTYDYIYIHIYYVYIYIYIVFVKVRLIWILCLILARCVKYVSTSVQTFDICVNTLTIMHQTVDILVKHLKHICLIFAPYLLCIIVCASSF